MTNNEIRENLSKLQEMEYLLEEEYMNNGGECTDYTEQQESAITALRQLIENDGIDSLGRWLKNKEDQVKALKAEKDSISRQINAANNTIDYIKQNINNVMSFLRIEKAKGTCYSFTATTSVKTSVDKEMLEAFYKSRVEAALTAAHIPVYIGVTLTASATKAKEYGVQEGDEELFSETSTPSVRFTKPRASKEVAE